MIVLDIETSGIEPVKCGIWQIGAIDLENPKNQFLDECRIEDEDQILDNIGAKKTVYEVTGKTEAEMRDPNKQSQKQLLEKFFKWFEKIKIKNLICQNPQFDLGFLTIKTRKYNLKLPFHYRAFDLHSIAQSKYFQEKAEFLIKEDHSDMDLTNILRFCGMKDERKFHNALEDAKLEAECFSRTMYGKNLLEEYKKFPVPKYLQK